MQFNKHSLLLLLILWACSKKEVTQQDTPIISEIATSLVSEIKIDSISLAPEKYSGLGRLELINNKIVYLDLVDHTVNFFDESLKLEGVYGGQGNGPNEVQSINYIAEAPGSNYLMIDNFGFNVFENDSIKLSFKLFDWDSQTSSQELLANPNAEDKGMYTIDWSPNIQSNFTSIHNGFLYLPIITEHPEMNAYQDEEFYTDTYAIGKFNIESGKLEKMGVNWPSFYLENKFIPNFAGLDLTHLKDHLIVGFQTDSLIHIYDENLQLVKKFGVSGKGFKYEYKRTRTVEEAIDSWDSDLMDQSYYASLWSNENMVFRIYHPNGKNGHTKMQVYQGEVLTHDVQVPQRFRVIGKIGDYYYADGHVSETDESLFVYRFKLSP